MPLLITPNGYRHLIKTGHLSVSGSLKSWAELQSSVDVKAGKKVGV